LIIFSCEVFNGQLLPSVLRLLRPLFCRRPIKIHGVQSSVDSRKQTQTEPSNPTAGSSNTTSGNRNQADLIC